MNVLLKEYLFVGWFLFLNLFFDNDSGELVY